MNYPFTIERQITYGGKTVPITTIMDNADMKAALGCDPKRHWPDAGVSGKVNGVRVCVAPKGSTITRKGDLVPAKSRIARRTFAQCPSCRAWVCAGHLMQHKCAAR